MTDTELRISGTETIRELRALINRHDILRHITTAGTGRTKAVIISDIKEIIHEHNAQRNRSQIQSNLPTMTTKNQGTNTTTTPTNRNIKVWHILVFIISTYLFCVYVGKYFVAFEVAIDKATHTQHESSSITDYKLDE
eukprot:161711_1